TEVESKDKVIIFEETLNINTRCTYLNKWLYYFIKIYSVPEEFIRKIFEAVDDLKDLLSKNGKYTKCYYESYTNNEDIIGEILMGERPEQYQPCLKYIYDCVNTYKKLNPIYCNNAYLDSKYSKLCSGIQSFIVTYKGLSEIGSLKKKLPDLDSTLQEFRAALQPSGETDTSTTEQTIFFSGPLKSKITTGVTAGVGACAFLGILYKVNTNYYIYRNITSLIFCL
ncbi:hypothetical protein PCYB_005790, partial [Plasmodium cynomolgi strain B]